MQNGVGCLFMTRLYRVQESCCQVPVLKFYDGGRKVTIECDASLSGQLEAIFQERPWLHSEEE